MSFGIPVELIPLTHTGSIKTKQLIQWINSRKKIEQELAVQQQQNQTADTALYTTTTITNNRYVDCPLSTDVVIRNGTASLTHPGNAYFRQIIATNYRQHSEAVTANEKVALTWAIVDQVTQNGRFLEWDRQRGCWMTITDRSQMRLKVALTMRDFKKVVQAANLSQAIASSTYKFERQDGGKRKREDGPSDTVTTCGNCCIFDL
jgi:hypothetical protein